MEPEKRFTIGSTRPNEYGVRDRGKLITTLTTADAQTLGCELLALLGWTLITDIGLKVGDRDPRPVAPEHVEEHKRRLKASGVAVRIEEWKRLLMAGPWTGGTSDASTVPSNPAARQRRFVKEPAAAPARPVARPVDERKVRAAARDAEAALVDKAAITTQLFTDPEEQLRYEITHFYLHSVPPTQREQYPLNSYSFLPIFLDDLEEQASAVSRQQMLAAIVDIVCDRVWDMNSRSARAKREGGGDDSRPQVVRSFDSALAWRANVSSGTPAARRIMWWQTPGKHVELARFATHDDFDIPER